MVDFNPNVIVVVVIFFFPRVSSTLTGGGRQGDRVCLRILGLTRSACEVIWHEMSQHFWPGL